jgi:hypothetical protein
MSETAGSSRERAQECTVQSALGRGVHALQFRLQDGWNCHEEFPDVSATMRGQQSQQCRHCMSGEVSREIGEGRETALATKDHFFKPALDKQARILRHHNILHTTFCANFRATVRITSLSPRQISDDRVYCTISTVGSVTGHKAQ